MTPEPGRPSDEMDWDAIGRFMAGESSNEEIETVSRWLAEHPEEAAALASLNELTQPAHARTSPAVDIDAAWARAEARLDAERAPAAVEHAGSARRSAARGYAVPARRSAWSSPALRAAAAIALLAGGALIWQSRGGGGASDSVAPARTFATAPAERDSVVLEDGTGVLLGPGSSLRTEAGYGDRQRIVHLEGEALFDVRHDDARPFEVHTPGLLIHDLGTTFTVRTTNGANGVTSIAVTVGAVRVARTAAGADSGVILRKGDRVAVGSGPIVVQRNAVLDDELAFTRGRLVFRDTPLPAVASTLRRWYGVRVEIADSTLDRRTLTASFEGETLADVLKVMGLALDAPIRQVDSVVVIGEGSRPVSSPR